MKCIMFPYRANHVDGVVSCVGILIISWIETLLLDFGVCGIYEQAIGVSNH